MKNRSTTPPSNDGASLMVIVGGVPPTAPVKTFEFVVRPCWSQFIHWPPETSVTLFHAAPAPFPAAYTWLLASAFPKYRLRDRATRARVVSRHATRSCTD